MKKINANKQFTIIYGQRARIYEGFVSYERQHAYDDTTVRHFKISVANCPEGFYGFYAYGYPIVLRVLEAFISAYIADNLEMGNHWKLVYFRTTNIRPNIIFVDGEDTYAPTWRRCIQAQKHPVPDRLYGDYTYNRLRVRG